MVPEETREIDGMTFQVKGLSLDKEREVLIFLTKKVGPALAELARGSANAGAAVRVLLGGLEDADVKYLIATFRPVTQISFAGADGSSAWVPCVDAAFKKGVSSQFKWLWFCLEHQYASFLGFDSSKLVPTLEKMLSSLKGSAAPESPSGSPQG